MFEEVTFVQEMRKSYDKNRKYLAYLLVTLMFTISISHRLPFLPDDLSKDLMVTLAILLLVITIEILFGIHEKTVTKDSKLKMINTNELYDEILKLSQTSKEVNIKCIGVAGRYGWYGVLSKLLDNSVSDSLHENKSFHVEVALISPNFFEENKEELARYDALYSVVNDIERVQKTLKESSSSDKSQLNLYHYNHFPNFVGFLVNNNYLFFNACYWDINEGNDMVFRGAGTEYLVYDKNDEFGGPYHIKRFNGWFDYILKKDEIPKIKKDKK